MVRNSGIFCVLCLFWVVSCGPSFAIGFVNSGQLLNPSRAISSVSFFARPFPFGYTGWGPCVRYVEVQTRWGLRLRRVRVCR
jgi:hypothetical protein